MRAKLIRPAGLLWFSTALLLVAGGQLSAQAAEAKLQAFLLWGTDDTKPPEGKDYKAVQADVAEKLKDLPLKWTHWFQVNRVEFTVSQDTAKEVAISQKCRLKIQKLGGGEFEITLIGKGKVVVQRRQSLPKGEMLVLGGNAPNSTAWLVVLKRVN